VRTWFQGLRDQWGEDPDHWDERLEARVLCQRWRRHYNAVRPHNSLGYRPSAPEAIVPWPSSAALSREATAIPT